MMRKLITAALAATIALLIMPATPAHAAYTTRHCRTHTLTEVRVCMAASWTNTPSSGATHVWNVKWTVRATGDRSLKELGFWGWDNTYHQRSDVVSGKVRRKWTLDKKTATFYDKKDTHHPGNAQIYTRYRVRFDNEFGGHPDAVGTLSYQVG